MINRLIGLSLRNRVLVIAAFLLVGGRRSRVLERLNLLTKSLPAGVVPTRVTPETDRVLRPAGNG